MSRLKQNLVLAEFAVKYVESIMSRGATEYDNTSQPFNRLGPFNRPEALVHRVMMRTPLPPPPLHGPDVRPETGFMASLGSIFADSPWIADQKAKTKARQDWAEALPGRTHKMQQEIIGERDAQKPKLLMVRKQGTSREADAIMCGSLVERSGVGNCGEQSYVAFKYLVTKSAPGLAIVDWDEVLRPAEGMKAPTGNHTFVVIGMEPTTPDVSHATLLTPPGWGADAVVCDPWFHEWFGLNDWQAKMKRILSEARGFSKGALDASAVKKADALAAQKAAELGVAKPAPVHQKGYAQAMIQTWKFRRLAYLQFADPDMKRLSCLTGNQLKTLHEMRAQHYRGHRL